MGQSAPPSSGGLRVLPMGMDLIHAGSMCLVLSADVESGTFFEGLTSHSQHGQQTFRVGSKEVKFFPEHVSIRLDGFLDKCGPHEEGRYRNDLRLDGEFMSSLRFKTYWKRGFDMRTVDAKVEKQDSPSGLDLALLSPSIDVWEYELSITAEDVPLTDSLVLLISDSTGKELSRLSGNAGTALAYLRHR